ncbi:hypothetical protein BR93DRAFT_922754 [Coniochaeta sp. PMI_546]|nr:hypothetical protein BR93DRAFT_922754 [Coniochaeta sp. PMI_546]
MAILLDQVSTSIEARVRKPSPSRKRVRLILHCALLSSMLALGFQLFGGESLKILLAVQITSALHTDGNPLADRRIVDRGTRRCTWYNREVARWPQYQGS